MPGPAGRAVLFVWDGSDARPYPPTMRTGRGGDSQHQAPDAWEEPAMDYGRGSHSLTSKLNLSAFSGIGGVRRDCVARVKGVFRVCRVFLCVRHGST